MKKIITLGFCLLSGLSLANEAESENRNGMFKNNDQAMKVFSSMTPQKGEGLKNNTTAFGENNDLLMASLCKANQAEDKGSENTREMQSFFEKCAAIQSK